MEPAYWRTPAAMETALRRVDDLPKELQGLVLGYVRYAFTNESLRATVKEYFRDKAACERRHGKIGKWDVGRVTDMSRLFAGRRSFNEAHVGVSSSRRASRSVDSTPRVSYARTSKYSFRRTSARGTRRR